MEHVVGFLEVAQDEQKHATQPPGMPFVQRAERRSVTATHALDERFVQVARGILRRGTCGGAERITRSRKKARAILLRAVGVRNSEDALGPATTTRREPCRTTDAELLGLVARLERDALGQLYQRHGAAVRAAARRITQDPGEAEDLVHDVFLEIWDRAADYEPTRGSVRTWLLLRARSRSLDRRRHLHRRAGEGPPPDTQQAVPPSAEELTLRDAVTRLPAPLRELLELGYYAGMSSTEMADALAIPVGTVKSRVARALAELRTALGDERPR